LGNFSEYIFSPLISTLFLVGMCAYAFAQPEPCDPDNPSMTPFCADCCIICNIDGFTGRHSGFDDGQDPPGFAGECTMVAHNMRWISFVAGSVDLKVELAVSNCSLGFGLEFGLYKGNDCMDFVRISNCYGGMNSIPPGSSGIIENTEPLVIGQYYYIVMDGALEDNCDWTFSVLEGSTALEPLDVTSEIEGEELFCPLTLQNYTTQAMEGATLFFWELNGTPIGNINENSVDLLLPNPGFYTLCCQAANACDEAIPTCKEIEVRAIPETYIVDEFCEGDCYLSNGTEYCETGVFSYTLYLENGCDSTVILDLIELPQPENFLDINICDGESIDIDGTIYSETGIYDQLISLPEECDSLIHLDLFVVICVIISESEPTSPTCHGMADGQIDFRVTQGTPPFTYSWTHLNSGIQGNGAISNLNENQVINGLQAGTYTIEIMDNFGDFDVIIQEVTQPEPLIVELTTSDYNGFGVSCHAAADGLIESVVTGGTQPYQYTWSNGMDLPSINNLSAGLYELTVSDARGCETIISFELISPPALEFGADFINPSCESLTSGLIEVTNITGGLPPYRYDLNSNGFVETQVFDNLEEGVYVLTAIDENGCEITLSESLVAPQIPVLTGQDAYDIGLGDSVQLQVNLNNVDIANIFWLPEESLNCGDCLDPIARPFNTTNYILTVTSLDDCIDTLNIIIDVEKTRAFYPPNIFSPNADGVNDFFALIGSTEVLSMNLSLYDRWGNIIFKEDALQPTGDGLGWDGRTDSGYVNPGVYVWVAEITFLDGETFGYRGDVTVVR